MGLYINFDAFNGAYSAFNRFRQIVAKAVGGSFPPHDDKSLKDGEWYWGEGFNAKTNPGLHEFFSHSDCNGEISPEMCIHVANELESLLPKIKELAETYMEAEGHIARDGGYVKVTEKFIEGCRSAANSNQPLEFG